VDTLHTAFGFKDCSNMPFQDWFLRTFRARRLTFEFTWGFLLILKRESRADWKNSPYVSP